MNKNTLLIAVTLTSSLLWAGCNKSGKLHEKSKFTPPSGPMELKQKWPKGEQIVKHIDMKMNSEINVPNLPNPIKQETSMGQKYGITVADEDANGGHEVDLEFLVMSMKMKQGDKTMIDYDSETKSSETSPQQAAAEKMFQGVIGTKLQYFLNATNGVDRVEGIDALMNHLQSGGPAGGNNGIKDMFNDAYLQQMLGDSRYLPPKPVQPSDTWPVQFDMKLGTLGNLSINYNFTFTRWEQHGQRTCARLEFDGTLKGSPVQNPDPKAMSMSVDNGTTSGVSWFDPELGATIDSDLNQDIAMTISMPVNMRGKTSTQTMKMQMHQVLNIKLDSVK